MDLCKFKDVLGKPKEGFHSLRFLNVAVLDVLGTVFLGFLLTLLFKNLSLTHGTIIMFLVGVILHRLFCVNTTINKIIFGTV